MFDWKRFWYPQDQDFDLRDHGFLLNPQQEWGHIFSPNVMLLDALSDVPVLILLGEGGMGKSTEISEAVKRLGQSDERTLLINAGEYQTDVMLHRGIFEDSVYQDWAAGSYDLSLFVDSFEEGSVPSHVKASLIVRGLRQNLSHLHRLRLRVACRSASLPTTLEEELRKLWPKEAVRSYKLAPLRRADVEEAARATGLDPPLFLGEILKAGAVPFATKPLSLAFLLQEFQRTHHFPSEKAELYLEGCRRLCQEVSDSRHGSTLLEASERLAIAARCAFVSVFCAKPSIWTRMGEPSDFPASDITISELGSHMETVNGRQVSIDGAALRETLNTGLFSPRGINRVGWTHQSYADFLAAWYIRQHGIPLSQIRTLLTLPGDAGARLAPQTQEVAAWLAGMMPPLFEDILKRDPEALLRSQGLFEDQDNRALLAQTLLRLYDEGKLFYRYDDSAGYFAKLIHPGLAEQLRPYLTGGAKTDDARFVAVEIVSACNLVQLQEELADIALEPGNPGRMRHDAVAALVRFGDAAVKGRFRPWASGEAGDDPDDEMKGWGLRAVWPGAVSADELFALLTAPKQQHFHGAYAGFLSRQLVEGLAPEDFVPALEWTAKLGRARTHYIDAVANQILWMAWKHLALPEVLSMFARVVCQRVENHETIPGLSRSNILSGLPDVDAASVPDEARRSVLAAVMPLVTEIERHARNLVFASSPLAQARDTAWILELFRAAVTDGERLRWAALLRQFLRRPEPEALEPFLVAYEEHPLLTEAFNEFLAPIPLDSREAKERREAHREMTEWENSRRDLPVQLPSPSIIMTLLEAAEQGQLHAWWQLNLEMAKETDSDQISGLTSFDITAFPGWRVLDEPTKVRVIGAAERFLRGYDPAVHNWLGHDNIYNHQDAFSGYRSLRLLWNETERLDALPGDAWKRWAPAVLCSNEIRDDASYPDLIGCAYRHAPDEILNTLSQLIDQENQDSNSLFIIGNVEPCWDDRLAGLLLAKANDPEIKPVCANQLLITLLQHGVEEAKTYGERLLTAPRDTEEARFRARLTAVTLIREAADAGWGVVWPAIQSDEAFGREVVSSLASSRGRFEDRANLKITVAQLAELYLWVAQRYPHTEDPGLGGNYSSRQEIAWWRDGLLNILVSRGAHQLVADIGDRLPNLRWLKTWAQEAQHVARRDSWEPFDAGQVLELAHRHDARLVRNEVEMLEVLTESLDRLERKLHDRTPAVFDLWNEISKATLRHLIVSLVKKLKPPNWKNVSGNLMKTLEDVIHVPKDEGRFSDYVKRHLQTDISDRGVIVNREVEFRSAAGTGRGERIDVLAEATGASSGVDARSGSDSITVVLEIKGCWNADLPHAMQTQMVDRYLKHGSSRHGIFLVGWFYCTQWYAADYRNKKDRLTLDAARLEFARQASDLSVDGVEVRAYVMNTGLG